MSQENHAADGLCPGFKEHLFGRKNPIVNKAFVREPDFDGKAFCPGCGSLGIPVGKETLDHQIRPKDRNALDQEAWFCPFDRCETAYFDLFERSVTVDHLQCAVYPKNEIRIICPCFGFSTDDLAADLASDEPVRIRELLAKSRTDEARCVVLAASGRCCLPEIQKLYMRHRG